jgi:quercetin dioxygenase-like cupin family protein/alkylhydroperoxidase/carboxymuconolactone decarboxylase family protein YurZ
MCYGHSSNAQEKSLTPKQESIVPIAVYTAKGDQPALKTALSNGLDAGLSINDIKEILIQSYAYTGFPRSLNAINSFETVVKERKAKGIVDLEGKKPAKINTGNSKYQYGKDVQGKLTGRSANSTQAFVPEIDTFLKEHLFADIFARDNLDFQSREIATITFIATIGGAESQLRSHLNNGRHVGLSERQLRAITEKLTVVAGLNAGGPATTIINGMFNPTFSTAIPTLPESLIIEPVFSKGEKVSGGNFSGDAWVRRLASVDAPGTSTLIGNVTFAPRSRTKWHLHTSGQVLLVTDGIGYYQERGQPIRIIRKGDVIKCSPNVAHWHGASPGSSMTHVTIGFENGNKRVEWFERVTDEEYKNLN